MTVLEVIQRSTVFLAKKGVDSPRLQSELLVAHVLQLQRLSLYLNFDRVVTEDQANTLRDLVKARGDRTPLQHILGISSFCGLEIAVNSDVLIPRPETEILAERAWQFLLACPPGASALDFGTGSGCIAIALAVHAPLARICALEMDPAALETGRRNALQNRTADRIEFYLGNGFRALPAQRRFDLIVSNPPYIPTGQIAFLQPEVRDHDPRPALDGGLDGLDFYRLLAAEAGDYLTNAGLVMLEFGDDQQNAVSQIFQDLNWVVEAVEKDYAARPRILVTRKKK